MYFCRKVLPNHERCRWKNFKPKKVEISNFDLQMCYIPQKKAENMYNSDSARKSTILYKIKKYFQFFWFSRYGQGWPKIFNVKFFEVFKKKLKKWLYQGLSKVERNKLRKWQQFWSFHLRATTDWIRIRAPKCQPPYNIGLILRRRQVQEHFCLPCVV